MKPEPALKTKTPAAKAGVVFFWDSGGQPESLKSELLTQTDEKGKKSFRLLMSKERAKPGRCRRFFLPLVLNNLKTTETVNFQVRSLAKYNSEFAATSAIGQMKHWMRRWLVSHMAHRCVI